MEEKIFNAATEHDAKQLASAWAADHPEYLVISMTPFTIGDSDGRSARGADVSCRITVKYKKK